MKKPLIVFGRPVQWANDQAERKYRFHFLPIFGLSPILRDGVPAGDSVGAMLDVKALDAAVEFCRAQQPAAFLFAPMYAKDGTKRQTEQVVRFLERMKTAAPGMRFLYWNGNQQGEIDYNVEAFRPFIDVVLTNTRDPSEHRVFYDGGFSEVRTFYQFGFDPAEHGRLAGTKPSRDVHFAGSQTFNGRPLRYPNSEWRYRFICRTAEKFDLFLCGKGQWPFPKTNYLYGKKFYDSFACAKVILGINHWDYIRYYTRRTVYALASGRPYAVRYIPGMECDFENGKHLCWFKEQDEGIEVIRSLLKDKDRAKAIGLAGRELAISKFGWPAMLDQFEKLLAEIGL